MMQKQIYDPSGWPMLPEKMIGDDKLIEQMALAMADRDEFKFSRNYYWGLALSALFASFAFDDFRHANLAWALVNTMFCVALMAKLAGLLKEDGR